MNSVTENRIETPLWPSLAIVVASVLWGLYWIPMRSLEEVGIEKGWPSLVLNLGVLAVLLPGIALRWRRFLFQPGQLAIAGLSIGAALGLYGMALNLTEVVRAVLLFYLSPAWSTLIGLIWLGERLTLRRIAALTMGFAGLVVVLGIEDGIPFPQSVGDWMALISGIVWSIGSAKIYTSRGHGTFEISCSMALGTVVVAGAMLALFPADVIGGFPTPTDPAKTLTILLIGILVLMMPILFLTVWGTKRLSPATAGILLLGDLVVAIASAAILLEDEPFGVREITGTLLIAGAGFLEVLPFRRRRRAVEGV